MVSKTSSCGLTKHAQKQHHYEQPLPGLPPNALTVLREGKEKTHTEQASLHGDESVPSRIFVAAKPSASVVSGNGEGGEGI
jgi:hypothetical protein